MKHRSLFKILNENLKEVFSFKFFLYPLAVAAIASVNATNSWWKAFLHALIDPLVWLYCIPLVVLDALIRAGYWYCRERNPSYIKKMQSAEELKDEGEND